MQEYSCTVDNIFMVARCVIAIAKCRDHTDLHSVVPRIKACEFSDRDLKTIRHLWKERYDELKEPVKELLPSSGGTTQ
jgi:hypothetical protein